MTDKKIMRLSSRGRRLGAFAIDEAFPFIVSLIACVATARLVGGYRVYNQFQSYGVDGSAMYSQYSTYSVQSAITLTICFILLLAYLIVQIVFYSKSQSIGKAILGMRVVNAQNGNPVGIWWMLLRELIVKEASLVCFGLGFIWILIDKRNRAWHDKILDTYVVDVAKPIQAVVETTAVETEIVETEPVETTPVETAAKEPVVATEIETKED